MSEKTPLVTAGEVTIEADEGGVMFIRTSAGSAEIIDSDIATLALARVRLLELAVEQIAAELERLKNG